MTTPDHPCNMCRLKKRGCNRTQPVCGTCTKAGIADRCSYRAEDMPPPRSFGKRREKSDDDYPPSLAIGSDSRATKIRRTLSILNSGIADKSQGGWQAPNLSYSRTGPATHAGTPRIEINGSRRTPESSDSMESGVDPLMPRVRNGTRADATARLNSERRDLLSPLVRLQRIVSRRTNIVKQEEDVPNNQRSGLIGWVIPQFRGGHDVLGSRISLSKGLSDRLVTTYLTLEYVNLPIFDMSGFKSAYEAVCSSGDLNNGSTLFYGALNVIFGISCLATRDMDEVQASAFYDHGQKLAGSFDSNDRSLLIQFYILQSQYLNAIGNPRLAWVVIGFAIRYAQSFGLPFGTGIGGDRGTKEVSRKIWHSAMVLERMLALQLGLLPQTSNPFQIPLPTHLDSDYIDTISGRKPSARERPSTVEFLAASARLYGHVEDIMALEKEYKIGHGGCAAKKVLALDLTSFLKVDNLLHDWNLSLPLFLQPEEPVDSSDDPIVLRQRNILRIRYLYVRLRLYRPLFILALILSTKCNCDPEGAAHLTEKDFSSPDSPICWSFVRDSALKCISAAMELVKIVSANDNQRRPFRNNNNNNKNVEDSHINPVPAYWENVDYIYASGTILIASGLCPFISSNETDQVNRWKIEKSWSKALHLLEAYEEIRQQSKSLKNVAQICLKTLKSFPSAAEGLLEALIMNVGLDERARNGSIPRKVSGASRLSNETTTGSNASPSCSDQTTVQRLFGWIESLPADLDG
ncbi:hypothetical protein MPDQ_002974 [Monascus purpureus]|uniref:Zn(2)-C6 fungal-type domain-containing protein n=1 Tax=Monascus purpureus TaxID=5098 RepID=A0A507R771_MONPU|nr:hypothetical protein MPDQ_002974 [Monascus purpureus]